MTERYCARPQTARARISSPVSRGQCPSHQPQEVLLAQFNLYVYKDDLNLIHFIFILLGNNVPRNTNRLYNVEAAVVQILYKYFVFTGLVNGCYHWLFANHTNK